MLVQGKEWVPLFPCESDLAWDPVLVTLYSVDRSVIHCEPDCVSFAVSLTVRDGTSHTLVCSVPGHAAPSESGQRASLAWRSAGEAEPLGDPGGHASGGGCAVLGLWDAQLSYPLSCSVHR